MASCSLTSTPRIIEWIAIAQDIVCDVEQDSTVADVYWPTRDSAVQITAVSKIMEPIARTDIRGGAGAVCKSASEPETGVMVWSLQTWSSS